LYAGTPKVKLKKSRLSKMAGTTGDVKPSNSLLDETSPLKSNVLVI
jgi:hypothetical protein